MSFEKLGLIAPLLKAIQEKGYTTPSPIQLKSIQPILEGRDILASAQTGTGKTAGFTLPMLQLLSESNAKKPRRIRALVIAPTRELAAQVYENVKEYSAFLDLKSAVVFGGVNANPQIKVLKNGIDILVATPGRLLDLNQQGVCPLGDVEILILDEADRMLDMGFLRDIKRILSLLKPKRQNLLFSATFSHDIKKLANSLLNNPVQIEISPEITTAERVNQIFYHVNKSDKADITIKLINEEKWEQVLIFTRTKHGANKLAIKLEKSGIVTAPIHGNKSQNARTKALAGFKDGSIRVLVATDIAARGLDIPLLPFVMNFELPNIPEDYVHRIGRTGRAGESGNAISLVSHDEVSFARAIEKLIGEKFPLKTIDGFEIRQGEKEEDDKASKNSRNANSRSNSNPRNNRNFKSKKRY